MRLHRSPFRRRPVMRDGYDEGNGPAGPFCFGPCPYGEWDDPTWISVEVDPEYMAAKAVRLERYAEQQRYVERKRRKKRRAGSGPTELPEEKGRVMADLNVVEVQFPDAHWEPNDAMDDPTANLHGRS